MGGVLRGSTHARPCLSCQNHSGAGKPPRTCSRCLDYRKVSLEGTRSERWRQRLAARGHDATRADEGDGAGELPVTSPRRRTPIYAGTAKPFPAAVGNPAMRPPPAETHRSMHSWLVQKRLPIATTTGSEHFLPGHNQMEQDRTPPVPPLSARTGAGSHSPL
jgi:hypothetical protein